jgi:predicted AAA+ superfamily ATPase
MLKRKAYDKLIEWKQRSNGKSVLVVEGARRVGKTTLVKEFGEKAYASCLFIDFFQAPDQVKEYFRTYSDDFDTLFLFLSTYYRIDLHERDTLVVFDEVQAFPFARGLLKYLVADGRFDYIETGSLLSIRQNVENIVIPSEEESLKLYPLDFEEFCWAMGEGQLYDLIRKQFEEANPLPDAFHQRANRLLREYMLVGGMPQAVAAYTEQRAFAPVDAIRRQIIRLYRNDVARFAHGYENKVVSVLDGIPSQLSKHEKRFQLSSLGKGARMRSYESSFFWLADARIVNLCFASNDPSVGLSLNMDQTSLKCYMADTGLLVTLAFSDDDAPNKEVYRTVLLGKANINEGMLVENVIAQMLRASGHKLFYYSQSGRREGEQRMEIDFLITTPYANASGKPRISPIEVKSSQRYTTTSLDRFKEAFGRRVGTQYVLHPKQLRVDGDRIYLPLYMAELL